MTSMQFSCAMYFKYMLICIVILLYSYKHHGFLGNLSLVLQSLLLYIIQTDKFNKMRASKCCYKPCFKSTTLSCCYKPLHVWTYANLCFSIQTFTRFDLCKYMVVTLTIIICIGNAWVRKWYRIYPKLFTLLPEGGGQSPREVE